MLVWRCCRAGDGRDAVHRDRQLGLTSGVDRPQPAALDPQGSQQPPVRDAVRADELDPHLDLLGCRLAQEHQRVDGVGCSRGPARRLALGRGRTGASRVGRAPASRSSRRHAASGLVAPCARAVAPGRGCGTQAAGGARLVGAPRLLRAPQLRTRASSRRRTLLAAAGASRRRRRRAPTPTATDGDHVQRPGRRDPRDGREPVGAQSASTSSRAGACDARTVGARRTRPSDDSRRVLGEPGQQRGVVGAHVARGRPDAQPAVAPGGVADQVLERLRHGPRASGRRARPAARRRSAPASRARRTDSGREPDGERAAAGLDVGASGPGGPRARGSGRPGTTPVRSPCSRISSTARRQRRGERVGGVGAAPTSGAVSSEQGAAGVGQRARAEDAEAARLERASP